MKSTKKPTKEEQARLDAIHAMQCICCETLGLGQPLPTEAHHLVDKGDREKSGGHDATIPLCGWHHRAAVRPSGSRNKMLIIYGPSLKWQGKKGGFAERFGTERHLLALTNEKIGVLK